MRTGSTLLCIHRDPAQLGLLERNGFNLVIATNGHDGLRLFRSQQVDAVVLDDGVGLLSGSVVALEIRKFKPQIPIVLLADQATSPHVAMKSVDALVAKSDGPRSLLATVHFLLNAKPAQPKEPMINLGLPDRAAERAHLRQKNAAELTVAEKDAPFSLTVWRSIWNGTFRF